MSDIQRPVGDFVWYESMTRDVAAARGFYGALFGWEAAEAGGQIVVPATNIPGTGRFAILRDPAGAAIGVIAPPAG